MHQLRHANDNEQNTNDTTTSTEIPCTIPSTELLLPQHAGPTTAHISLQLICNKLHNQHYCSKQPFENASIVLEARQEGRHQPTLYLNVSAMRRKKWQHCTDATPPATPMKREALKAVAVCDPLVQQLTHLLTQLQVSLSVSGELVADEDPLATCFASECTLEEVL